MVVILKKELLNKLYYFEVYKMINTLHDQIRYQEKLISEQKKLIADLKKQIEIKNKIINLQTNYF